jgi:hypothetical protein
LITNRYLYTAITHDQVGRAVSPQPPVTWALAVPTAGVTVHTDGTVVIDGTSAAAGTFTLVATAAGGLSGKLAVVVGPFKVRTNITAST